WLRPVALERRVRHARPAPALGALRGRGRPAPARQRHHLPGLDGEHAPTHDAALRGPRRARALAVGGGGLRPLARGPLLPPVARLGMARGREHLRVPAAAVAGPPDPPVPLLPLRAADRRGVVCGRARGRCLPATRTRAGALGRETAGGPPSACAPGVLARQGGVAGGTLCRRIPGLERGP